MVSTHFRQPSRPPGRDLRILELFGDIAGEAVARHLDPGLADGSAPAAWEEQDDPVFGPAEMVLAEFASDVVHRLFAAGLSLWQARRASSGTAPRGSG